MKKGLKKLYGWMLVLALLLGMAMPMTALADDEPEDPAEKIASVTGVPAESDTVWAGDELALSVTVEGLNSDEVYCVETYNLETADGDSVSAEITGKTTAVVELKGYIFSESIEISLYKKEIIDGEAEWVWITDSDEYEITLSDKLSASMQWDSANPLVVGTEYPFSITVKNLYTQPLANIKVYVFATRDLKEWDGIITYLPQEGVTISDGEAYITSLNANDTITIKGTVRYPAEAVGDSSRMAAVVMLGQSTVYTGAGDTPIKIVAAGTSQNPAGNQGADSNAAGQNGNNKAGNAKVTVQAKAARTGDAAPIVGVLTALVISMAMIAIMMKKRARG